MSEPFLAAHASVADAIRAAAPLVSAHPEIVQLVADHVRIGQDGTVTILDHDGTPALDRNNGFAPMSPAGFVAQLRTNRPELFDANAKPPASKPEAKPNPAETFNLTDLMVRAAKGDAAAMAAINAHARTR